MWTLENGSLFLLETNASNPATELTFLVRDYDTLTANDFLGSMSIPCADLADGNSERLEFSLTKEDGTVLPGNARLVLRYRPASETDIVFVKQFALDSQSNVFGGASNQTFVPPIIHKVARSGDTRKGWFSSRHASRMNYNSLPLTPTVGDVVQVQLDRILPFCAACK